MSIFKMILLLSSLLFANITYADVYVNNYTLNKGSYTDIMIVGYRICNKSTSNFISPLCGPMQFTRKLYNMNETTIYPPAGTGKEVDLYQIKILNDGFHIYTKDFNLMPDGTSSCKIVNGTLTLSAYNYEDNVSCNGFF